MEDSINSFLKIVSFWILFGELFSFTSPGHMMNLVEPLSTLVVPKVAILVIRENGWYPWDGGPLIINPIYTLYHVGIGFGYIPMILATFFFLEKKFCWKKAVKHMRQLGTTGTHHPHFILSCKTLSASLQKYHQFLSAI